MWTGWRGTREEPQRSSRLEKLDMERMAERNGLAQLSEEKAWGEALSPHSSIYRVAPKKMEIPFFYKDSNGKDKG